MHSPSDFVLLQITGFRIGVAFSGTDCGLPRLLGQ
jgi:hypothetical protein